MKTPEQIKEMEKTLAYVNHFGNRYFKSLMVEAQMDYELGKFTKGYDRPVSDTEAADDIMTHICLDLIDDAKHRFINESITNELNEIIEQEGLAIDKDSDTYSLLYRRMLNVTTCVCFNKVSLLESKPLAFPVPDLSEPVNTLMAKKTAGFPTPEGSKWEDVMFKVINDEEIEVSINGENKRCNYKEMGFENKRTRDNPPIASWGILTKAFSEYEGTIDWDSNLEEKNTLKQHISKIRQKLREFIGIDGDPIYPWKRGVGYMLKMKIYDKRDMG